MSKYSKQVLEQVIPLCKSIADVCRYFGAKPATGAQSYISKLIKKFELDISHFTGQAWNRGMTFEKRDALEYCFKGSTVQSHKLKLYLVRDGYKEAKCENCNLVEWLGEPAVLELDHIDSDHANNEYANLQILCPNCHAMLTRKRREASVV